MLSERFANNARASLTVANDGTAEKCEKDANIRQQQIMKKAWTPFRNWILGMFISFIPIFCYPFHLLITDDKFAFGSVFPVAFCSSEVIFLAISLSISSLNDSEEIREWKHYGKWNAFSWFFIVLGAVLFGFIAVAEKTNTIGNFDAVMVINIVLFTVATISGAIPYIVAICDAKKSVKEGK